MLFTLVGFLLGFACPVALLHVIRGYSDSTKFAEPLMSNRAVRAATGKVLEFENAKSMRGLLQGDTVIDLKIVRSKNLVGGIYNTNGAEVDKGNLYTAILSTGERWAEYSDVINQTWGATIDHKPYFYRRKLRNSEAEGILIILEKSAR